MIDRALATAQPLAAEIEELSTLVKQLADFGGGARARALAAASGSRRIAPRRSAVRPPPRRRRRIATGALRPCRRACGMPARRRAAERKIAAFAGLDRDGIIAAISSAIDASKIDLYLQPMVTLPQRKVRYYEALSRLKAENGDLVAAGDFLAYAEAGALMPKLDNLLVLRCVQVVRRLLLKNRDIGLFCNVSGATLTDSGFPQISRIHGRQPRHRAVAGLRIHPKRGARHGADRAREPRRARRTRLSVLDGQPYRSARRARAN